MDWGALFAGCGMAALGVALMALEAFIPGFSVCGILGLAGIGASAVVLGINFGIWAAVASLAAGAFFSYIVMRAVMKSMKRGKLADSGIVHKTDTAPVTAPGTSFQAAPGRTGIAASVLRPHGKVKIEGKTIEAVSEDGMIDRGESVQVTRTYCGRVYVKKC